MGHLTMPQVTIAAGACFSRQCSRIVPHLEAPLISDVVALERFPSGLDDPIEPLLLKTFNSKFSDLYILISYLKGKTVRKPS
jgi:hypothetical protein